MLVNQQRELPLYFVNAKIQMYSFVSGLYQHLNIKPEFRVLVIGSFASGKTTFVRFCKAALDRASSIPKRPPIPTVGCNTVRIKTAKAILTFWDLGGQDDLQPLWSSYYSELPNYQEEANPRDFRRMFNLETICNQECMILNCCLLKGEGVIEGVQWLLEAMNRNIANRKPKMYD
ncbi:hypothetical protein ACOME3_003251 [Neoechinorhynchus agilis]